MVGADIDQVVDAERGKSLLICENRFCAFVFIIPGAITPGFIERAGGFVEAVGRGLEAVDFIPVRCLCFLVNFRGNLVVTERNVIVFSVAEAGINKAVRLVLFNESVNFLALRGCERHRHIKPSESNFAVFSHNFFYLRQNFLSERNFKILFLFVGEIPGVFPGNPRAVDGLAVVAAAVFLVPVEVLRVIDAEFQAVFAASIGKFFYNIALKGRKIITVVAVCIGFEKSKVYSR